MTLESAPPAVSHQAPARASAASQAERPDDVMPAGQINREPAGEGTESPVRAGSAAWHARRQSGIGSSEIAALFGLSPYGGPLDVYLAKTADPAQLAAAPATVAQRRGSRLEAYLADEAAERFGWKLVEAPGQAHPLLPYLNASPDRLLLDEAGNVAAIVEIKTSRSREGWADPEDDPTGVPAHYLLQVQHQMLVGVRWRGEHVYPARAYIVACVGHLDDLRLYAVDAHPGVADRIVGVAGRFWREHVEPRVPPAFDGSAGGDRLLAELHPFNRIGSQLDEIGPASPAWAMVSDLARAQRDLDAAQREHDRARQVVQAAIGDRAGFRGEGFSVSWRATSAGSRIFRAKFDPEFPTQGA